MSPYRITIIICGMILSSCGNYIEKKTNEPQIDSLTQEKLSTDFASVREIIFEARCVSCHQQYSQYSGVVRELQAIRSAVSTDRMPKTGGPLSENQKSILFSWIDKGAPELADKPTAPANPIVIEATWNSLSDNVIFPKCLACHNPQGQAKLLDLSTRQAIFENRNRVFFGGSKLIDFEYPENSYLVQILKDEEEPMPPIWSNISTLSNYEIETIILWIRLGLP